jgi:2-oxoisovalerate dehydrogenase E2 component (dihydrolipoyl transacylase)
MSRFEFKLPDLGEGTIEAEIVEWKVKAGDRVSEEDVIVDVMTEKANIELPSPVTGTVISTTGEPGDMVAVGSTLIVFETDAAAKPVPKPAPEPVNAPAAARVPVSKKTERPAPKAPKPAAAAPTVSLRDGTNDAKVLTSPSIRRRAREAGIDLGQIIGSGPEGRITNEDFEAYANKPRAPVSKSTAASSSTQATRSGAADVEEIKVIGVRRVIAQRLSEAKRTIPHFAYVEEIDVTELESLRAHLNEKHDANLTYLPFLALALVRVLPDFPQCNSHYDAQRGVLLRHRRVHLGIATQTPDGLKVPVVHDAQNLSLWTLAQEIRRVSDAARGGSATKDELTGSTITVTSLGRLGGIASTPIINAPEVGIIGVNKAVQRPMVVGGVVAIRLMMNLSSSFDHRFVDGYDAAAMIQALKQQLEHPATIFIDG